MIWTVSALTVYALVSLWLMLTSFKGSPHLRRRLWRLEAILVILFALTWPVTVPLALYAWHMSAERKLLAKRAARGEPPPEPFDSDKHGTPGKTFVPRNRKYDA